MTDTDALAAVRERIAEMRSAAAEDRASAAGWRDDIDGPDTEHAAYNERRAESLEWAANALEAALDHAPCGMCSLTHRSVYGDDNPPFYDHAKTLPLWLAAARTRATATTEGAR